MTRSPDPFSGRIRSWTWLAVPAAVMAFVVWDAVARSRHIVELSAQYGVAVDAPLPDERSPTGYEGGRRSMILPEAGEDTAHWVMQTQTMIARGEWRLRSVDYDNAPRGREVHWASPFHWWLATLAWIDHFASGRALGASVDWATLTSGTVMFGLMLIGLTFLLARKFSPAAAAIVAVGAVATYPFYTDFLPGRADHHGLANICGLLSVLLLAAASVGTMTIEGEASSVATEESRVVRTARKWFVGSALAGGVGLWISAATLVPVLIGIGLGVLAANWFARSQPQRLVWMRDPNLFRVWGCVGGGVSVAAYLIEYFPAHLGMRLEVNHPLYAAAWIGAGEVLRAVAGAMSRGVRSLTRRDLALGASGAALVVLLPIVIAITGERTFTVAEPFIWRLHTRYIAEFQSLGRVFATKGLNWGSLELCWPMLLLLPPVVALLRPSTREAVKAQIALALAPALVGGLMGLNQVRWLGLAFALSVPVVAVFFRALEAQSTQKRALVVGWLLACGVLFAPGAVSAVQRTLGSAEFTTEEVHHLAERDVAHWLRLRVGEGRVVVAGAPSSTTALISFGGVTGLDTLYWENAEGLKHAGALFAASIPETAHDLARRLGLTHIVFFSWDAFEVALAKEYLGLAQNAPLPPDMFVANLLSAVVPPAWLRAIPFKLPDNPALAGAQVRIWEVTPNQTPAEAAAQAANYYLELGLPQIAGRLAPVLEQFKDELTASVMLAGIASRQHDAAGFSSAAQRVLAHLSQAQALSLDDHIHLVVVLAIGQQENLAREQLRACLKKMDERSLRRLTPGTLSDLLALCDALNVELPDPALKRLAGQLVPPSRRK